MTHVGAGRHCMQCDNIVYDFTQMSDGELLNFLKLKPEIHCGRFHNAQLNRDILPTVKKSKSITNRYSKIAAAVFTLLSFKGLASPVVAKNTCSSTVLDFGYTNRNSAKPGKIIITGTIKDGDGKPLEKATVTFDSLQVAITDNEGRFSFELDTLNAASHNLYFSYDGFITAVRNYHPAMLAANYNVVLTRPGSGFHTMGIMLPPGQVIGDLPSLVFKKTETKLSTDNKTLLSAVAIKLKNYPYARIIITAYPGGHLQQAVFTNRLKNIKKYLIENEGISADRIATHEAELGGDKNTVDIRSDYY
jgi:hypothetical protein